MKARLVTLPKITEPERGSLTVVQRGESFPFPIQRTYWTYDVPAGEWRGGHAHKQCRELILAVSGSFTLKLDDGHEQCEYQLKNPFQAVLVEEGVWRELHDFSTGAVCLVLASDEFDEEDYIRDYDDFLKAKALGIC